MSFKYTSNIFFFIIFIFTYSCQYKIESFNNSNKEYNNINENFDKLEDIDLSFFELSDINSVDYYTSQKIDFNFLNKEFKSIKINNYEGTLKNNLTLNIIYKNDNIYSVNSKGELLKFDRNNGKIKDRYSLNFENHN